MGGDSRLAGEESAALTSEGQEGLLGTVLVPTNRQAVGALRQTGRGLYLSSSTNGPHTTIRLFTAYEGYTPTDLFRSRGRTEGQETGAPDHTFSICSPVTIRSASCSRSLLSALYPCSAVNLSADHPPHSKFLLYLKEPSGHGSWRIGPGILGQVS